MTPDTREQLLQNVRKDLQPGDQVTFAFQGGEPTLVGLPWFRDFFRQVRETYGGIRVSYALQTNGTLLDHDWCVFLRENRVLVGLSLDSLPKYHNACRVDAQGDGTYGRVLEAAALLREHRVEFNILCTLTAEIARHPGQVWKWILQNDFRYVQFTPCLDELNAPGSSPYALKPEKFAAFYKALFPLWLQEFQAGRYRSIKLFDDIVNLLAYGVPTACGIHGQCQCQLVVEADGSTYPCDFYCLDCYRLGYLQKDSFLDMMVSDVARKFLTRPREDMTACRDCPYLRMCRGGCRRMQREICCVPGSGCCGYRELLDTAMPALQQIALQQRRYGPR